MPIKSWSEYYLALYWQISAVFFSHSAVLSSPKNHTYLGKYSLYWFLKNCIIFGNLQRCASREKWCRGLLEKSLHPPRGRQQPRIFLPHLALVIVGQEPEVEVEWNAMERKNSVCTFVFGVIFIKCISGLVGRQIYGQLSCFTVMILSLVLIKYAVAHVRKKN